MSIPHIGITVLWLFLYGYLIVASIGFGAGLYAYYVKWRKLGMVKVMDRYVSPVWEAANIFFVLFSIGLVIFFPDTAYYYGTAFLIPGSIVLVLLAVRVSFYAFEKYAKQSRIYMFLYGMTGLLIPTVLSTALTISEGGFLEKKGDEVVFSASALVTNFYSWSVVLLAIVSVLYISASFLAYDANRIGNRQLLETMRKFALLWAAPTIFASILIFLSLREHNLRHFQSMLELDTVWMFVLSFGCFLGATHFISHRQGYGTAFLLVMFQFFFAFFGYGAGHLPYILDPYITIYSGFTNETTGRTLVIIFIIVLMLFIPLLYFLLHLFLFNTNGVKGRK